MSVISVNHVISIRYALSVDGQSVEDGQLDYLHGFQNIVPGLEAGLDGSAVGESRSVEVPPELGYGPHSPEGLERVPRAAFPQGVDIQAGMQFAARTPDGSAIPVWVAGVEGDTVLIDTNHPMAGKTLNFEVTVLSVRAATEEEISQGHPHGPDGDTRAD